MPILPFRIRCTTPTPYSKKQCFLEPTEEAPLKLTGGHSLKVPAPIPRAAKAEGLVKSSAESTGPAPEGILAPAFSR
jgi:hypothetical protein